ncbi:MAG: type II secretion system protein, partial [Terrimicrobiaceae bacterium]
MGKTRCQRVIAGHNCEWKPKLRGFTLVELLVVIGILAVLAALLAPMLSTMQKNADRTKATGLMRSVGTAIFAKASENNGRLPGPLWPGQVAEYDNLGMHFTPLATLCSRRAW